MSSPEHDAHGPLGQPGQPGHGLPGKPAGGYTPSSEPGQTGPGKSEPGQPGPGKPEPGPSKPGQTGPDQAEQDQAGPDQAEQGQPAPGSQATRGRDVPPPWLRTSAVVLGSVTLVVILLVIAAATLPTWWATTVGAQVDGIASAGTLWGLFYGTVFTLLPLVLVPVVWRVRWPWKVRVVLGALALVLLLPNLLTLAVSIGASERTRQARTLLTVQAPNFRISTLIGVVVTLVVASGLALLLYRMTASRRELRDLRTQAGGT